MSGHCLTADEVLLVDSKEPRIDCNVQRNKLAVIKSLYSQVKITGEDIRIEYCPKCKSIGGKFFAIGNLKKCVIEKEF